MGHSKSFFARLSAWTFSAWRVTQMNTVRELRTTIRKLSNRQRTSGGIISQWVAVRGVRVMPLMLRYRRQRQAWCRLSFRPRYFFFGVRGIS